MIDLRLNGADSANCENVVSHLIIIMLSCSSYFLMFMSYLSRRLSSRPQSPDLCLSRTSPVRRHRPTHASTLSVQADRVGRQG